MNVELVDEPKARTRRRSFNYVREGRVLRHVSEYATGKVIEGDEKAWRIAYEIPLRSIEGKWTYKFSFKNKGNFVALKCRAEDLLKEGMKYVDVNDDELKELEIEIRDEHVKNLASQAYETYFPMIKEVNDFAERLEFMVIATGRLDDWLRDPFIGLRSNLCIWPEASRAGSIKSTSKLVHQLWVFKLIHKALGCKEVKRGWLLKLGSRYPASIFMDGKGAYWTGWWEPQRISEAPPDYRGPLCDFFEGRVVWKRPDMLFSKGIYDWLTDAPAFDILIECKNFEFEEWWRGGEALRRDLKPYIQLFKPGLFILASLNPVPGWAKELLERNEIIVIDELYVGGEGVQKLMHLLRERFYV